MYTLPEIDVHKLAKQRDPRTSVGRVDVFGVVFQRLLCQWLVHELGNQPHYLQDVTIEALYIYI